MVLWCKQNNGKNNANKIFIEIKNIGVQSKKKIFFTKEYFSSDSFALAITWRTTMTFSWFRRSIEGYKWLILEWTRWMTKNACSSSFAIYWTCKEIWWSFFFCCEASFPVRRRLWIFSLGFFFSNFLISDFWISPPFWSPVLERRRLSL